MLNRVIDRQGNYMTYHYSESQSGGTWRIDRIEYTGNESATPELETYNTVKFYYSERSDVSVGYVSGSKVKSDLLLRKIRTFAQGDFAHEYRFRYYDDGFASHLNEITEVSHTGERLNSTVVGWGEKATFYNLSELNIKCNIEVGDEDATEYVIHDYTAGDYNCDGIEDLLLVYQYTTGYPSVHGYYRLMWRNAKTGGIYNVDTIKVNNCLGVKVKTADLNADGFDDALRICIIDGQPITQEIDLYLNSRNRIPGPDPFNLIDNDNVIQNVSIDDSPRFYPLDMDGDGKDEILKMYYDRISNPQIYWAKLYKITDLYPFDAEIMDSLNFDSSNLFSPFEMLDMNGNGKPEMVHVKGWSDTCFRAFEYSSSTGCFDMIMKAGFPTETHDRFYGDFNGDGITDVLTHSDQYGWELHYSNGLDWVTMDCPINRSFDPDDTGVNMFTTDVNGDGKADIVEIYPETENDVVKVYSSHGTSFTIDSVLVTKDVIKLTENKVAYGDLSGDGSNSFIFDPKTYSMDNGLFRLVFCAHDKSNLLTNISNGLGQNSEISYRHLHFDNAFYNYDDKPTYPLCLYRGSRYAVDSLKNQHDTTTFTFQSFILHKQGKGLLGLEEFTSNNITRDIETTSKFDFNTNFYFPVLSKRETRLGAESTLVSSVEYFSDTLSLDYTNDLIYLNVTDSVFKYDELRNISIKSRYNEYDDFGNIKELEVDHNGEGTTTSTTSYTGAYGNGSLCDYLPQLVTVDKKRGLEPTISIQTSHSYSGGLLSIRTLYYNHTGEKVYENYGYDDFGNVTSLTLNGSDVNTRASSTTYDTRGRFPLTQTNPLSWTESFEYDHRTGQVLKATDVNGLVTRYKYDGFGRARLSEYPDGINLIEKIAWYTGGTISNARYYTEAQATGSPPARTWYDRMGRELQSRSTDFAGNYVYTKVEYDSKGRKQKVYEPYASTAGLYTEFTYDNLGRNDETILPTGVRLMTSYSHIAYNKIRTYKLHTSSVWADVTKTMNAFGQAVSIEDEGGEITYEYYSTGLPKSITANSSTITMEYDIHGNRTSIDDPDAGEITTDYNSFDELIEQTDARNKTYTMAYDKLGRITSRSGTETTTWTYSTTAGDLGELSSVSCNNNTSQSFAYDDLGRAPIARKSNKTVPILGNVR